MKLRNAQSRFVIFTRKGVWVSELSALFFICILLVGLVVTSAVIVQRIVVTNRNNRALSEVRLRSVPLAASLAAMQEESRTFSLLDELSGGRLSDSLLSTITQSVMKSSNLYGYDPLLLLAVVQTESRFYADIVSTSSVALGGNAIGLMQLQYSAAAAVASDLGIKHFSQNDLLDPETNLIIGVAYLTRLIAMTKNFKLGLIAYNQGVYAVYKLIDTHQPISDVYYRTVLATYHALLKRAKELRA